MNKERSEVDCTGLYIAEIYFKHKGKEFDYMAEYVYTETQYYDSGSYFTPPSSDSSDDLEIHKVFTVDENDDLQPVNIDEMDKELFAALEEACVEDAMKRL